MATVFWDSEGVILVDFLERDTTINSERYCETLRKLRRAIQNKRRRAIQNKRRGKLSGKVLFFHDVHTRPIIPESS